MESEKKWLFVINVYIKKYALLGSKQEIVAPNLVKTFLVGLRLKMSGQLCMMIHLCSIVSVIHL